MLNIGLFVAEGKCASFVFANWGRRRRGGEWWAFGGTALMGARRLSSPSWPVLVVEWPGLWAHKEMARCVVQFVGSISWVEEWVWLLLRSDQARCRMDGLAAPWMNQNLCAAWVLQFVSSLSPVRQPLQTLRLRCLRFSCLAELLGHSQQPR